MDHLNRKSFYRRSIECSERYFFNFWVRIRKNLKFRTLDL